MDWRKVTPIPGGNPDVWECQAELCGAWVRADRKEGHDMDFHHDELVEAAKAERDQAWAVYCKRRTQENYTLYKTADAKHRLLAGIGKDPLHA